MIKQISTLVALLASYAVVQAGHSALGSLVTHQGGSRYEFSETVLGAMLALTYFGFFIGNYLVRYLLPRISYIRTFAVCAAVMAVCTMLHPIFPGVGTWMLMRFAHGVFFSCTVVICDGWFNSSVPNETRSRFYAVYMVIGYLFFGLGNYILLFEGMEGGEVFAYSYVAILLIVSLLPLCMTRFPEPQFAAPTKESGGLSLLDVYRIAPIAVIGHFFVGMIQGASFLFIRYADSLTDDSAAVATLAVVFFSSGFLLQWPAGWLFDRMQEKRVLMGGVYLATMGIAGVLFFGKYLSYEVIYVLLLLYGAIASVPYSLNIVYGQNFVETSKSPLYSGRMFQVYAMGAIIGPFAVGFLMDALSVAWLFGFCGIATGIMGAVTLTSRIMPKYLIAKSAPYQLQSPYVPPTAAEEQPLYNEYDVGPQLPETEAATMGDLFEPQAVGPDLPETFEPTALAEATLPPEPEDGESKV